MAKRAVPANMTPRDRVRAIVDAAKLAARPIRIVEGRDYERGGIVCQRWSWPRPNPPAALSTREACEILDASTEDMADDLERSINDTIGLFVADRQPWAPKGGAVAAVKARHLAREWRISPLGYPLAKTREAWLIASLFLSDDFVLRWPAAAAPLEVVEWAREALNRSVAVMDGETRAGDALLARVRNGVSSEWLADLMGPLLCNAALVMLAERAVQRDRERPMVAIDSGKQHNALLTGLAFKRGRAPRVEAPANPTTARTVRFEWILPGFGPDKPNSVQLSFLDDSEGIEETILTIRSLSDGLGLRCYAALQRLLSVEGGRTGRVWWTLDDQLRAMNIDSTHASRTRGRRAPATLTDGSMVLKEGDVPAFRDDVSRIVEILTRIRIAAVTDSERFETPIVMVGPSRAVPARDDMPPPLVEWRTEGMELLITAALYSGVRNVETGALGSNWGAAPVELAHLDHTKYAGAIALGLILAARWRLERGDALDTKAVECCVTLKHRRLLKYLGIEWDPRRRARIDAKVKAQLEALRGVDGLGRWEWRRGADGMVIDLYAPAWASDRALRNITPIEPKPIEAPKVATGSDLKLWRAERELSQAEAGARLGFTKRAVQLAEAKGEAPLSPRMREALEKR